MVQNWLFIFMNHLQAARETGALKEAKDKLEKRVEELTWRLGLEKRLRVPSLCSFGSYF
jgi:hypothetical protein